jgi:iron complex transport system ATP-binding protein
VARGAELADMSALLSIQGASVRRGRERVLDAVSMDVGPGEVVGVLGANGSGKTTLLRAALGLIALEAGSAALSGDDVHRLKPAEKANRVGYLPQERRLAWNVPAWRAASLGAVDRPPAEAREIALACLDEVGLSALAERGVFDMSGGERARVLLARLFATRAPLLIADEPAAGLDPDAQFLTLELLRAHAVAGGAVVVTLHDLGLAARMCDRLLVLCEGRVAAAGSPIEALTPKVLAEAFGLQGELIDTPAGLVIAARRLMETAR